MLDARHAAGEGTAERLTRAALDALVIYPWPNNFVELDQAIRHAVRRATGQSIGIEHLPLAIRSYRPGENPALAKSTAVSLDEAVERYELRLIHEALEAAGGNRAEASRRLGISRARLLRKIDDGSKQQSGGRRRVNEMIEVPADRGIIRPWIVCDAAVQRPAVQEAVVQGAAVQDAVVRDAVVRDAVVRDAVVQDAVVRRLSGRWITAVRRFAPELMPPPLIACIVPAEPPKARAMLRR